ncbi:hypothetical protein GGX14DRAFT_408004 [Mycena pura]|uniref:Uncharacterized protein n=1 Tax=Mycena pura TaxID=153505 RepID=A0AAD6UQ72_9AGAR|nr:hypothetical protein GGX14DRAFT_408004 [Mycena pura]
MPIPRTAGLTQWVALLVTFVNNEACSCIAFVKGGPHACIALDNAEPQACFAFDNIKVSPPVAIVNGETRVRAARVIDEARVHITFVTGKARARVAFDTGKRRETRLFPNIEEVTEASVSANFETELRKETGQVSLKAAADSVAPEADKWSSWAQVVVLLAR